MGPFRRRRDDAARRQMFDTKSHAWREVGLARELSQRAARRALRQLVIITPLLVAVLLAYKYRQRVFGLDVPVRVATVVALVVLGWAFARDVGRALSPALFRRMDPATAGTVGFLIRLATIGTAILAALNIAGLPPRTLAVGGAFTAVIVGLAAQQTLGNLIAGMVLLSARPFRVGERVRFQGGGVGGRVEGVVSSLGLLYTTLRSGEDRVMVPNSVVLALAVSPLREPDGVDLRARLPADVNPSELQERLGKRVSIETLSAPDIVLEEFEGDEVVLRIVATPVHAAEGPKLADEILGAVAELSREGADRAGASTPVAGER